MKITLETANKIREMYSQGAATQAELAERYKVSQSYISYILTGRTRICEYTPQRPERKLNYEDAVSIRQLYAKGGISQRALANKFNVSQSFVSDILNNKCWNNNEEHKDGRKNNRKSTLVQ